MKSSGPMENTPDSFVVGRSLIQISAFKPAKLTDIFRGFPQFLQEISGFSILNQATTTSFYIVSNPSFNSPFI
jgi:hypothetical protein